MKALTVIVRVVASILSLGFLPLLILFINHEDFVDFYKGE